MDFAKKILFSFLLFIPVFLSAKENRASFIWIDESGAGRQVYAYFRYDLKVNNDAKSAKINLFADSRYHLFVNGQFVNFGPVRFNPAHPEYDSLDILPYLIKGNNVIAVKVLSNGMNTFQIPKNIGGFIGWGEVIEMDGTSHSLATPGAWICKPVRGYDPTSPKVSFALHVLESYDSRMDQKDWNLTGADLKDWKKVSILKNQDAWGQLKPRSIPLLTQYEITPKSVMGVYSLKTDEDIYSFRVKTSDTILKDFETQKRVFAYTYIYSPKAQQVTLGMWWGEFWLNGGEMNQPRFQDSLTPLRKNMILNFKEGWNYLFIKYDVVWASWDYYLAVPKSAQLSFSPDKKINSKFIFMTAGPFTNEEEKTVRALTLPFASPSDIPVLSAGWIGKEREKTAGNPALEVAWSYFDKSKPFVPTQTDFLTIDDTTGTAFVLDMGGKQLGRVFVDVDAPAGTVLDIVFTEDLLDNRPWIMKRTELYSGTRFITSEGHNRFETFNPYGSRYIQVNIRKNKGPVTINKIGVIRQVYPFEKTGSFECSDPLLNAIWELGYRTLRVCAEDSYIDTPFRERGLYAGDALPEYAITLATSNDSRLIKRSLLYFQDQYKDLLYPENIQTAVKDQNLDFPLITLLYYRWCVRRTNDKDFAAKLYLGYKNLLDGIEFKKQTNGLYESGDIFIEWTKMKKNNYSSTALNALLVRSFEDMADMAGLLGKNEDQVMFLKKSSVLKEKINALCWDEQKGAFRDGISKDVPIYSYYPISSAYMSMFGYTTAKQEARLKVFFENELKDIGEKSRNGKSTPYGGFYVLAALYRHQNAGVAENFIKKYWGPMILHADDTAWEDFNEYGNAGGTMSHAWSGAPTYYLTTQVLGVNLGFPSDVNYDSLIIAPQAENITWAKGTVSLPKGIMKVEWKVEGNLLFFTVQVPDGVSYKISPRGNLSNKECWVNGKKYIK